MLAETIEALEARGKAFGWMVAAMIPAVAGLAAASLLSNLSDASSSACLVTAGVLLFCVTGFAILRRRAQRRMRCYQNSVDRVETLIASTSSAEIREILADLRTGADGDPIISAFVEGMRPAIRRQLHYALDSEARTKRAERLGRLAAAARNEALSRIEIQRQDSPAIRAQRLITTALETIKQHSADAERQLVEQREKRFFKWWFDFNRPDFAEVDAKIAHLEQAQKTLKASGHIEKTNAIVDARAVRVVRRTAETHAVALSAIPHSRGDAFDEEQILRSALMLSALSVPVSAWGDMTRASDVYDSLREVNGNYVEMSDFDIWLDTLMVPGEQLAGLAALTKGAYFEKLVEADFGGESFEHFNHPGTDITIDGVDYQIKATDSASYIDTVGEGIPVISTSEVAQATASIDGGYTNADLTDTTDLALGGTVLDIGDATLDALFTGMGGIGLFSVIRGISSGWSKYKESGDAVGSLAEGMNVAIFNTARTGVNMAELTWRGAAGVATSRPVRFAGRVAGGAIGRLDRWIENGEEDGSPAPRRR